MSRGPWNFAALVAVSMVSIGIGVRTADAAGPPTPPTTVDSWAWCGVNPDDPVAADAVWAMAHAGGIDATFGPCNVPDKSYTPADTANRYVAPDVYMRLVQLNASVGMKTVVYDARLWSDTASVRNQAIAFWQPVLANIAAWDMGDEFPFCPNGKDLATNLSQPCDPVQLKQWPALVQRWSIMRSIVEPATGIQPFTNFRPF